MEKTVLCPVHKEKQLVFEKSDVRPNAYVAICRCDPNDKKWFGKPVAMRIGSPADEKVEPAELVLEPEPAVAEDTNEFIPDSFSRRKRRKG